jgi:gliding motility-associated-like protein
MKSIPFILAFLVAGMAFGVDKPKVPQRSSGFVENKGQIIDQNDQLNPNVLFLLPGKGLNVQLRKSGFSYDIYEPTNNADSIVGFHRIDIDFENMNPLFEIVTEKPSEDYLNYYTTGAPESGVTHIRSYEQVTYRNIYPGIDIIFYSSELDQTSDFKYDFVVHPGAEVDLIKLKYSGINGINVSNNELHLLTRFGAFVERIPQTYYKESKKKVDLIVRLENQIVTYSIESIEVNMTLIIDPYPERKWVTYYGGNGYDALRNVTCSKDGKSLYAVGWTESSSNIATSGAFQTSRVAMEDGFVVKMGKAGNRIWASYMGGSNNDRLYDLSADNTGNIYICGETYSNNFPTSSGAMQTSRGGGNNDAVIVKFDSTGSRIWSTLYGGNGWDEAYRIIVSRTNHIYIGGKTSSTNVIATSGAHQTSMGGSEDGFLTKLNTSNGYRIWSTYYGGSQQDYLNGLSDDNSGATDFFITGLTYSSNNISTTGAYQASFAGVYDMFLCYFDSSGKRKWSTYFGGTAEDYGTGMACDSIGNAYIYGYTTSTSGIATAGAHQTSRSGPQDIFMAKFNKSGQRLWGTYYGGTGLEVIYRADVYLRGFLVITGYTSSVNGISTSGVWQTSNAGGEDCFIAKFNTQAGKRIWGSYFGSTGDDRILGTSLVDYSIYAVGVSTSTSGFATSGAHQTSNNGAWDAFIARFEDDPCFLFSFSVSKKDILCKSNKDGVLTITPKDGAYPYLYQLDSASPTTDSIIAGLSAGIHKVLVVDANGCRDSLFSNINEPPVAFDLTLTAPAIKICYGSDKGYGVAQGNGGNGPYTYLWNTSPPQDTDTAKGLKAGIYQTMGMDKNGCKDSALFTVAESPLMALKLDSLRNVSCYNGNDGFAKVSVTGGTQTLQYSWSSSPAQNTDSAVGLPIGYYRLTVTDSVGCLDTIGVTLTQPTQLKLTFDVPGMIICQGSDKGYAYAKASGGTGTYGFSWNTNPVRYTDTINGLKAGAYQATVKDQNGCKDSAVFNVTEVSSMATTVDSLSGVSCFGGNDGYVKVSVSGGIKPFTYLWSSSPPQNTDSATKLTAGYYKFTVTDSIGCQDTLGVIVSEPAALKVTLDATNMLICPAQSNGLGHATGTGGTTPYNFSWNSSPVQNTDTARNLVAGTFKVLLTDRNACKDSAIFTVIESPKMIPIIAMQRNVTCFGGNNGFTKVSVSGGTKPLKYAWSANLPQWSDSAINLSIGTYTCVITDSIGCRDSLTALVTQPAATLSLQPTIINESCDDAKDGEISVVVSGGTKPWFYSWNTTPAQNTNVAMNLTKGNYTLLVTDSNGCTLSADYTVTADNALPQLTMQSDTTICLETALTIKLQPHRNMTYLWNDGDTSGVKTFSEAGLYAVTAFNICGDQTATFTLITRNCSCFVHIPNVFTPTQDLLNETFRPLINCDVRNYEMKIYSRWGEHLFTSIDVEQGWTGVYLDKLVPQTAYFYMIDFVGSDGIMEQMYHYKGMVTLLR